MAIPGFGTSVLPRITNLTGIDGLFNGADDDSDGDSVDDLVAAALISLFEPIPPGPFASIRFDCVAADEIPDAREFTCTGDVSDYEGVTLAAACAVEIWIP